MNDLMLDVECMGNGQNGALVGIGAVFFDEQSGQLGAEFYRAINLATAVRRGGEMEAATVTWWLGQADAARNAIRFNCYDIDEALADFVAFAQRNAGIDELRVWGCSPSFDCDKVASALKRSNLEPPWRYWNERCYRTIRERNRSIAEDERPDLHNALSDAKHQAGHLIKIRKAAHARKQAAA